MISDAKYWASVLRTWAIAYRAAPKELRFPCDPNAEFFPVDMERAADELERKSVDLDADTQ